MVIARSPVSSLPPDEPLRRTSPSVPVLMKRWWTIFAALCTGSADSALVTDSVVFGPSPVGVADIIFALELFDPSLGVLTGVKLTLEGATCGNTLCFDNEARDSGAVDLAIGTSIAASISLAGGPVLEVAPVYRGSGWVQKDRRKDGAGDFTGSDSFRISGGGSASASTEISTPFGLAAFTAQANGQTFLVTIANSLFSEASTCGIFGPTSVCAGSFSGVLKVAYSYLIVPVPEGNAAYWGAGVALIVGLRRSRPRRALP